MTTPEKWLDTQASLAQNLYLVLDSVGHLDERNALINSLGITVYWVTPWLTCNRDSSPNTSAPWRAYAIGRPMAGRFPITSVPLSTHFRWRIRTGSALQF